MPDRSSQRERPEVVVTGVGVISPLGIGHEPFWQSIVDRRSGVRAIESFDASALPVKVAAEVRDFVPKEYVRPRKSLKVMARDSQFAVAASDLALADAGVADGTVDPERFGVILGADRLRNELTESAPTYRACLVDGRFDFRRWAVEGFAEAYPLGFLKVLPNMPACHVSILHDARGPNNTLHQAELSGLLAVSEAARLIERGAADIVLVGGVSSRMHPVDWARHCLADGLSRRNDQPEAVSRPFDLKRDGQVVGEGGALFVLESRTHAEARGARIRGRLLGYGAGCEPLVPGRAMHDGSGIERAIHSALDDAHLPPRSLGFVSAHGLSTQADDRIEAKVIQRALGEVPVFAAKSYFGNLLAAAGALEMAAALFALNAELVPTTINFDHRDPECPVDVVRDRPLSGRPPTALLFNHTTVGQAAAVVVGRA